MKRKVFIVGNLSMDLSMELDHLPKRGENISDVDISHTPAGKGLIEAISSSFYGAETYILGSIGVGAFGNHILDKLNEYNVNTKYIKRIEKHTGINVVMMSNGESEIITSPGANKEINEEDISRFLENACEEDVLVTSLELPMVSIKYAVSLAKSKGLKIILNPTPLDLKITDVLYDIDYLILNEMEYKELTGQSINISNASIKVDSLNTIVTLGERGVYWIDNDLKFDAIEPENVVDDRYALDFFIGSFASQVALGKEITYSIAFARTVASLSTHSKGIKKALLPKNAIENKFLN